MMNNKFGLSAVSALVLAAFVGSTVAAVAQSGSDGNLPAETPLKRKNHTHGSATRTSGKALTIARTTPAPGTSPASVVTAPIGLAGSIVTAPLSGLSQAFGYGAIGGPAKPLPIVSRYAGVGPVTDSINQGWAQPVPVAANGPVYKLEDVKNTGMVSPFALIAAPITAATTLASAPFNAAGSLVGAPPAPAPVF